MEDESKNAPVDVSLIVNIIITSITCPFTVLLNVLVIMAVKRRPRLQSNANILLACLAATDALTGLIVQPSFLTELVLMLLGKDNLASTIRSYAVSFLDIMSVCSCLQLMLVTCERLLAIKFTMHYPNVVKMQNIKVAIMLCWIFSFSPEVLNQISAAKTIYFSFLGLVLTLCVLFIAIAYAVLYQETRRHQKMIKTQQLPQEEVEQFLKESKALKTTVYVVGAVVLCLLPTAFLLLLMALDVHVPSRSVVSWMKTCVMLNSLLNPLTYCWRQKEMRKFVFRFVAQAVHPSN